MNLYQTGRCGLLDHALYTFQPIYDKSECIDAWKSINEIESGNILQDSDNLSIYPSGCWQETVQANKLHLSPADDTDGNSVACSNLKQCLCKAITKVVNKCACPNGVAAGATAATQQQCVRNNAIICTSCHVGYTLTNDGEFTCTTIRGWLPNLNEYIYKLITEGTCQTLNVAAIATPGLIYDMTTNPYLLAMNKQNGARDMCNQAWNEVVGTIWTFNIDPNSFFSSTFNTASMGAAVTQGTKVGKLKIPINGLVNVVVIEAAKGVTFVSTETLLITLTNDATATIDSGDITSSERGKFVF